MKTFATKDTPSGFPMAVIENKDNGEDPRTEAEMCIIHAMARIRDKPNWWLKIQDEHILESWETDILDDLPLTKIFIKHLDDEDYSKDDDSAIDRNCDFNFQLLARAIQETKWKASQISDASKSVPAGADGVYCRQEICAALLQRLVQEIEVLRGRPAIGSDQEDRHPGTPQMVNLVHPSLYCYEQGKTLVLPKKGADAIHQPDNWACMAGGGIKEALWPTEEGTKRSFWEPIELEDFMSPQGLQWLPAEFWVNAEGTSCEIRSYINSLHPKDANIYQTISELFVQALPTLEDALTEAKAKKDNPQTPRVSVNPNSWWIEPPEEDFRSIKPGELEDEYMSDLFDFQFENRSMKPPQIQEFEPPLATVKKVSLQNRPLQVIVKIASLELNPEEEYEGGTWHVEGALNERIVATACCYVESTNVMGGDIHFRVPVNQPNVEHNDHEGAELVYGFQDMDHLVQESGYCTTSEGRILAWPNTLQHCVAPVNLVDPFKAGKRTICCFFLVDPTLRIRSTATVLPQQMAWYEPEVKSVLDQFGMTERGVQEKVMDYLKALPNPEVLTYKQACERRKRLMEERKAIDYGSASLNIMGRMFGLCEH